MEDTKINTVPCSICYHYNQDLEVEFCDLGIVVDFPRIGNRCPYFLIGPNRKQESNPQEES